MDQIAHSKVIQGISYYLDAYLDPFNKRVRIDDYRGNIDAVVKEAERLANELKSEKIIFKARVENTSEFFEQGYRCEGKISGYFHGSDAYFFSKFYHSERLNHSKWIAEEEILSKVRKMQKQVPKFQNDIMIKKAGPEDSQQLANLYRAVFPVYPTPLHDSNYIEKTIEQGTKYLYVEQDNAIVSAASAEVNSFYKNAELTDCATLQSHRKHGYVKRLLRKLEEELKKDGIFCVYSLARAQSFGMNAAFFQLGYVYQGRLLNNCLIFDKLENMSIWTKDLSVCKTD